MENDTQSSEYVVKVYVFCTQSSSTVCSLSLRYLNTLAINCVHLLALIACCTFPLVVAPIHSSTPFTSNFPPLSTLPLFPFTTPSLPRTQRRFLCITTQHIFTRHLCLHIPTIHTPSHPSTRFFASSTPFTTPTSGCRVAYSCILCLSISTYFLKGSFVFPFGAARLSMPL